MNILKFKIPLEVHFRHPVMVDDEYNKHLLTKKVPSKFGITKKNIYLAVILIAVGWFGHKYKEPIVDTVKGWIGK